MKTELEKTIAAAVKQLFGADVLVELTRPEEKFGDYSTNVALQLSKQVNQNPREIGEKLADKLRENLAEQVSEVTMAGPGFVNLKLSDQALLMTLAAKPTQNLRG